MWKRQVSMFCSLNDRISVSHDMILMLSSDWATYPVFEPSQTSQYFQNLHSSCSVSTVLPAAMEPWPVHQTCYLSQTCCFQLSRDSRIGGDTLNDRLWIKANWHLLVRCWPVAPSTTTVITIIWPCWSSMNIWTSWPCSVIISTWHSQKRTGHPSAWFLSRFLPRFWPF